MPTRRVDNPTANALLQPRVATGDDFESGDDDDEYDSNDDG